MALKLITAPAVEPVTATEFKLHNKIDIADDDAMVTIYNQAARQDIEHITRRAICTQTWDLYLDDWPDGDAIEIPLPPLQSITSVKYYDDDNTEATFASTNYIVDVASDPGRIVLYGDASWPSTVLRPANGIIIRFLAGYGAAADVPTALKQAILLLGAHFYENRESVVVGKIATLLPQAVNALIWPYRVFNF